ncbi:hypothetical protein RRG08_023383 [Elysia crispata]|uniref:WAP four-disulfide core domain protein 1 n=1 Tax=Elysia crispata TaxID=231223 RepID=A0AAE1EDJ5_9GAST|nr:hypothetical protein RRG08_023383 [Elysia crispata]
MRRTDGYLTNQTFFDADQFQTGSEDFVLTDTSSELCPRVPHQLPVGSCDVQQCISDDDCSERQRKCCYNGCAYTCLPEVYRPAHLDWIKEPKRRLELVETCSTSFQEDEDDDSDPLLCPHGYQCSIDDPGKPEAGIPNRGHCVKVMDVRKVTEEITKLEPSPSMDQMLQADAPYDFPPPQHCMLGYDGLMLLSGHSITKNGTECFCVEAELKCGIKEVPAS